MPRTKPGVRGTFSDSPQDEWVSKSEQSDKGPNMVVQVGARVPWGVRAFHGLSTCAMLLSSLPCSGKDSPSPWHQCLLSVRWFLTLCPSSPADVPSLCFPLQQTSWKVLSICTVFQFLFPTLSKSLHQLSPWSLHQACSCKAHLSSPCCYISDHFSPHLAHRGAAFDRALSPSTPAQPLCRLPL